MSDPSQPGRDCPLCPRLVAFRVEQREKFPDWHNAPVDSFGDINGRLLIVGLAPGLRGANRTSRPFTGDWAGDLLYQTIDRFGFSQGRYDSRPDDGLSLTDCRITNAVRCVPPENKPIGAEVKACAPFLLDEIEAMPNLKVMLALGGLAHGAILTVLGIRKAAFKFGHRAMHPLPDRPMLANSYHCSRYNTNTGRLTEAMFEDVFRDIRRYLDQG
ncbi:MAG: uracil-DNA glycosylase [Alphaproteobacteria bacterium]|jgi:uracil-DNA glycosylase family 4|nr:uracil-DNA glycosylase [Alphaproteobacteria bacterium]